MDNLNCFVAGIPGSGKSTFFENEIFADIQKRERAVFVIDPHGEMTRRIADSLPRSAIKRTVVIDAADDDYAVGFDPLRLPVHILIDALRSIWEDSWGPQLEYLLKMALKALSEYPGATLRDLIPLYSDRAHQAKVLEHITNPDVRHFWKHTFPREFAQSRKEPTLPVINKIDTIINTSLTRILCQKTPKLEFKAALEGRYVVLVNLNKPRIGSEASAILGALTSAAIYSAVLELNEPRLRTDQSLFLASLFADEFRTYGTSLYKDILTEPRKFGLNKVYIATQYMPEHEKDLNKAILGTVARRVIFRVDHADAVILSQAYNTDMQTFTRMIANLPPFQALDDGELRQMPPFIPPFGSGKLSDVLLTSRRRFGRKL